jgi:hypothetical protein
MTRKELRRAVRLIYRHQKLREEVEALEERIIAYMSCNQATKVTISGYKVTIMNDELIITEAPKVDERQLELLKDYFCLEFERAR